MGESPSTKQNKNERNSKGSNSLIELRMEIDGSHNSGVFM
jgi:hypothetical protein